MFTHRDARSGDPNLHTHVAVSNKVQDADGPLARGRRPAAVQGQRHPLGDLQHPPRGRAGRPARGPVRCPPTGREAGRREAAGARDRRASTRAWPPPGRAAAAIEARRRELAASFQAEHGRPPTAGEAIGAGQAGHVGDPAGQARAARRGRPARGLARRGRSQILGSEAAVDAMVDGRARAPAAGPTRSPTSGSSETAAQRWWPRGPGGPGHLAGLAPARRGRTRRARADRHPARRARDTPSTGSSRAAIASHCIAFDDPDPLTDTRRQLVPGRRAGGLTRPAGPASTACTALGPTPPRPSSRRSAASSPRRNAPRRPRHRRRPGRHRDRRDRRQRASASTPPSRRWSATWPPPVAGCSSPSPPPAPARPPPCSARPGLAATRGGTVLGSGALRGRRPAAGPAINPDSSRHTGVDGHGAQRDPRQARLAPRPR